MPSVTPFFADFHRRLFGKAPLSALQERLRHSAQIPSISHYQELFGKLVPQALLALQPTGNLTKEELKALPDTLQLRLVRYRIQIPGCRCQEVILVTTLLDAHRFSAAQLAGLYFRRWGVDLHFRQIKILLGMDVLRCLSPTMIRKELLMHLVAYNLIRALMQRASLIYHVPLGRLSFKGTLDSLHHFAHAGHAAHAKPTRQRQLFDALLLTFYRSRHRAKP